MSDTRRETVERVAAWRIDIANAIEGAGSAAAFDIPALLREDSHYLRALLARAEAAEGLLRESRDLWPVLAVSPFRGEEEVTLDRVVAHRQRVAALLEEAHP